MQQRRIVQKKSYSLIEVKGVSKKDQCKALMTKLFGPATANIVDTMGEDDCVQKCRDKVKAFLGDEKAKEFDNIR
jgi:hypothetical protein